MSRGDIVGLGDKIGEQLKRRLGEQGPPPE